MYWDYGHTRGNFAQALRMGDWKGVRNGPNAVIELYDLAQDLGETTDVAAQHPDIVARIDAAMREAFSEDPHYHVATDALP